MATPNPRRRWPNVLLLVGAVAALVGLLSASSDIGTRTKATVSGGPSGAYHCSFSRYWMYGASDFIGKHSSSGCTTP